MVRAQDASPNGVVLIVEDQPLVRMTTVEMAEEAGLAVIAADNADEALGILRARDDVRAIFTDVDMPGSMNGLEFAMMIRRDWPAIQTVITSGGPPPANHALPKGMAFFGKPYSYASVIDELRRSMDVAA